MSQREKGARVKLGGLWRKRAVNGTDYYTGTFGTMRVMLFENSYRTSTSDPDLVAYVMEEKPQQESEASPAQAALFD